MALLFSLNSSLGYCTDSLQVWSKVQNPTKEFLASAALKNILERLDTGIDAYSNIFSSRIDESTVFRLDLRDNVKDGPRYGKKKVGVDWVAYCYITIGEAVTEYLAVIHPDNTFSLEDIPKATKKSYAINYSGNTVIKPLEGIDPEGIKNILVYTDSLNKLGDTTIAFWPLVSLLYKKFPNATIHVKCNFFNDIFAA